MHTGCIYKMSPVFQGSTVNMNVMQPLYDSVTKMFGIGHTTLGFSLLIGKLTVYLSLRD